jgi:protein DGCR14
MMLTPSPAPGVDQSPFMTWGSIEGTPLIVETETPLRGHSGPTFKIPDTSRREKLVHELVDESNKQKKQKMLGSKKDVRYSPMRSPGPGSSPMDHQLRASYASPVTKKTPRGASTPNVYVTPKVFTPNRTPTKPL